MNQLKLKPTHKPIVEFYTAIDNFATLGVKHEGAVSSPFAVLLEQCGKQFGWTLVQQFQKKLKGKSIRLDGAIVDEWSLTHGFWEAKDSQDDLRAEIKKKFVVGYPKDNIIFQSPNQAILFQNGREVFEEALPEISTKEK